MSIVQNGYGMSGPQKGSTKSPATSEGSGACSIKRVLTLFDGGLCLSCHVISSEDLSHPSLGHFPDGEANLGGFGYYPD